MIYILLIPFAAMTAASMWGCHKLHQSNRELMQLNATLQRKLLTYRNQPTAKRAAIQSVFAAVERNQYGRG